MRRMKQDPAPQPWFGTRGTAASCTGARITPALLPTADLLEGEAEVVLPDLVAHGQELVHEVLLGPTPELPVMSQAGVRRPTFPQFFLNRPFALIRLIDPTARLGGAEGECGMNAE